LPSGLKRISKRKVRSGISEICIGWQHPAKMSLFSHFADTALNRPARQNALRYLKGLVDRFVKYPSKLMHKSQIFRGFTSTGVKIPVFLLTLLVFVTIDDGSIEG